MNNTWALVLAAGEGSRLRSLTTNAHGVAVPKQFCSLRGGPSFLQETLHRAEAVVSSRQRICAIVAAQHRRWWEGPLWSLPMSNVIVQPDNRGTANGILLPLLHIAARDPNARVVLLPSDHFVREEAVLARSLRQAVARLATHRDEILLLGIEPDGPDSELGYIVPAVGLGSGIAHVAQFVEKPSATLARQLLDHGALWNAFIIAGTAQAFIDLYRARYPEILAEMQRAVKRDADAPHDPIATQDLYERLPELDFSRHVLEGGEAQLRVLAVPHCGWSDLGTPKRVAQALSRSEHDDEIAASPHLSTGYINLAVQHARLQRVG